MLFKTVILQGTKEKPFWGWSQVYEATKMTNFTPSSSAYENNLGLAIRNELKPVFIIHVKS